MTTDLKMLIDAARFRVMSPEEHQAQRRSFAYGNVKIGNDCVTREMVDDQDELLQMQAKSC